jgi:hypothetical protein
VATRYGINIHIYPEQQKNKKVACTEVSLPPPVDDANDGAIYTRKAKRANGVQSKAGNGAASYGACRKGGDGRMGCIFKQALGDVRGGKRIKGGQERADAVPSASGSSNTAKREPDLQLVSGTKRKLGVAGAEPAAAKRQMRPQVAATLAKAAEKKKTQQQQQQQQQQTQQQIAPAEVDIGAVLSSKRAPMTAQQGRKIGAVQVVKQPAMAAGHKRKPVLGPPKNSFQAATNNAVGNGKAEQKKKMPPKKKRQPKAKAVNILARLGK